MAKEHHYSLTTNWTGNQGSGTNDYRSYERSHDICIPGKVNLQASSDPAFLGDATKHNPEELLLAALSGCHMLWYLHLCAVNGVIVTSYQDNATAIMQETKNGSGQFTSVTLNPVAIVTESTMIEQALKLHIQANQMCFIANSCNFPVLHHPTCTAA